MKPESIRIILAQLNMTVGDIDGNTQKIINACHQARDEYKGNLIVFPELALSGYPPEDLLFRRDFNHAIHKGLSTIQDTVQGIDVILGYPEQTVVGSFNKASLISDHQILTSAYKQKLPNYGVFDENRYFTSGSSPCVFTLKNVAFALTICEDLWYPEPMAQAVKAGARIALSINASPYDIKKPQVRQAIMSERAREGGIPLIYVNLVGGQDELVFDGGAMVFDDKGTLVQRSEFYKEMLIPIDVDISDPEYPKVEKGPVADYSNLHERAYQGLVLGVRDYVKKNNFPKVIIGTSGGIDSALTLTIAVDALGAENVKAISMPSRYTSQSSLDDAKAHAKTLGVEYTVIPIDPMFQSFLDGLADEFKGLPQDVTEENLQARIRGILLMAVSNKTGALVLSTGNKSEMAVGYSTLYGDMVGGFCVLKDVAKTLVYTLARHRNAISAVIPENILQKAPSAELAPDQKDEDALPPYSVLDPILERYIEQDQPVEMIIDAGFDEEVVKKVVHLVHRNEYKRRQAPPGVRITPRAFGRDRRYPITSKYR